MDTRYIERMEEAFKHKRYFISIIRELAEQRTPKQTLHHALHGFSLDDDKPASILDYGCGSGLLTYKLAQAFPKISVIGYDQSLEMVEVARERFSAPNLHFTTNKTQVESTGYDFIVLSSVLHEIYSSQDYSLSGVNVFLNQLSKRLKYKGHIITRDNYSDSDLHTTLKVQFLNEQTFYQALVFYDALLSWLPERLTGHYDSLRFDGDMLTLSGDEPLVREFMNKLTWGVESLPREATEILFFAKEAQFRSLGAPMLKLVAQEHYRDNDYLSYLEKHVHQLKKSEWLTHTWRIFTKVR